MLRRKRPVSALVPLLVTLAALAGPGAVHLAAQLAEAESPAEDRPPNIIILLADDLGYGELGCQGNPEIPTPRIDSIAENGVRFTQGYVTAANCSPSRAGLLTGRIPTRFGYEFNPIGARNEEPGVGLTRSITTIAEALHARGYTTALIGKWHLGGTAPYHPLRRGFDEFFGFLHEGHFFVPPPWNGVTTMLRRRTLPSGREGRWTSADQTLVYSTHMRHDEPPYDANNPILRGGQPVVEEAYLTDAFTREAVDFIDRHAENPFFLYLAYNAVHSPLQGSARYMKRFERIEDIHRRIFAAMLANLDDSVGQILRKVQTERLEENTLIVFLSDNGGPTRELTSKNDPLRGGKSDMYEGGIRVPFIMQWPGSLPAGEVYEHPVSSLDLFPTATAIAGANTPAGLDGVNLMPYLRGDREDRPHETLYWRQGTRTALRHGDWKLVQNGRRQEISRWELFHLPSDIAEENDLSAEEPDTLQLMIDLWKEFNAEMVEPAF